MIFVDKHESPSFTTICAKILRTYSHILKRNGCLCRSYDQ